MTNMESKEAKLSLMSDSRGIQLTINFYTLSLAMGPQAYSSNRGEGVNTYKQADIKSATSVEVAIFDDKGCYMLPQDVAGWVEVSLLPDLIHALDINDLPWAIRICGQTP